MRWTSLGLMARRGWQSRTTLSFPARWERSKFPPMFLIPATTEGEGMSDDELLETYRAAVNRAMSEAYARDGFASNMSRESIVAGLRAVFDIPKGEGN